MSQLIFLHNEHLDKIQRDKIRAPINFISFAYINAKMYKVRGKHIVIPLDGMKRAWGNDKVYGALFLIQDFHYYIRLFDAYNGCSLSRLFKNHTLDYNHRLSVKATLIGFNSLKQFGDLRYKSGASVDTYAYFGNSIHPYIEGQIKRGRSRVLDGLDKDNFKKCFNQQSEVYNG